MDKFLTKVEKALEMTEKKECVTKLDQQQQHPPDQSATAEHNVVVKSEKIDIEIEAKLRALNARIKSESATPTDDSDASNSNDSSQDDKKQVAPVKSSNEILAELFGVFNAAPPEVLLDDKNLLKKHKKSKKEKKKKSSRSKPDRSDGECSDSDADVASGEGKHKHKSKRKKHKHKHKDSKDKHKDKDREKSKEKVSMQIVKTETEKSESRKRHVPSDSDISKVPTKKQLLQHNQSTTDRDKERDREKERERERERDRERERERDRDREREKERERDRDRERERERGHNSFYNGYHETGRGYSKDGNVKPTKIKTERRQSDELSLSDEETYLREKANGRRRFYGGDTNTNTRTKQDSSDSKRHSSSTTTNTTRYRGSSSSRHRTRSRSRSRDLGIDKKRLLEIARRNAISMFKRGSMAGVAEMTPEVKDKVLLKMRYGGRTVQDLTDFCKKISNGEMLSELSSDEDSDVDKNGNAKAFHHPFQLKEREPIVMHIRNSTPIVPSVRREEQTKAITMQFPVSSGQVHRMSEVWVPVAPKEPLAPLPVLPPAKQATNMFKDVQRNVFAKSIPQQEQQEPAFTPATTSTDEPVGSESNNCASMLVPEPVPVPAPTPVPVPAPVLSVPVSIPPPPASVNQMPALPPTTPFVPEVPIPSVAPQPSPSIFPQAMPPSMDVSSIITQRLSAIRRLQDNPADSEALKMMYNAQRDMKCWASSKHLPGQFTGSTGAQVMKVHELNSGPQLWARRDQLTSTKPVTGGMGMTLLQKMGWKPGEGLGRTKTGSLQPLQLTVKLDKRGLVSREDLKQQPVRQTAPRGTKNTSAVNIAQAALTAHDKHPVCVLNELTSKNKWTPPQYQLKEDSGPSHSRMFLFSVEINGQTYTPTQACNNKKEAKLNAAKLCLRSLGILPPS